MIEFDGKEIDFEDMKTAVKQAETPKERTVLKNLVRGLRPVEIAKISRIELSYVEVRRIVKEILGEDVVAHDFRKALFQEFTDRGFSSDEAAMLLDFDTPSGDLSENTENNAQGG